MDAEDDAQARCPSGIFVDGRCCTKSGMKLPVVGGVASYYTSYSLLLMIISSLVFVFGFLPLTLSGLAESGGLAQKLFSYGVVPVVLAGSVNSLAVFVASQVMMAFDNRLWNSDHKDHKVTVSGKLVKKMNRGNFMAHTAPMLVGLLMLFGTISIGVPSATSVSLVIGIALLWLIILAVTYSAIPVSKERDFSGAAQKKAHGGRVKKDLLGPTNFAHLDDETPIMQRMVNGLEKIGTVYQTQRPALVAMGIFVVNLFGILGMGGLLANR
jgi:hypothetical protein